MKIEYGKIVANNIKAERSRANKTQEETASYLGLTRQQYQKYESDATNIKLKYMQMLSEYFNCKIEAFCLGM